MYSNASQGLFVLMVYFEALKYAAERKLSHLTGTETFIHPTYSIVTILTELIKRWNIVRRAKRKVVSLIIEGSSPWIEACQWNLSGVGHIHNTLSYPTYLA
jgi:hypothetical protein